MQRKRARMRTSVGTDWGSTRPECSGNWWSLAQLMGVVDTYYQIYVWFPRLSLSLLSTRFLLLGSCYWNVFQGNIWSIWSFNSEQAIKISSFSRHQLGHLLRLNSASHINNNNNVDIYSLRKQPILCSGSLHTIFRPLNRYLSWSTPTILRKAETCCNRQEVH